MGDRGRVRGRKRKCGRKGRIAGREVRWERNMGRKGRRSEWEETERYEKRRERKEYEGGEGRRSSVSGVNRGHFTNLWRLRKGLQTSVGRNVPTDSKGRPRWGHTDEPRSDWVHSGHTD